MNSEHESDVTRYLAERDKHLEQFMAINTKALFTVFAVIVSALIGLGRIPKDLKLSSLGLFAVPVLFIMGVVFLTIAAYMFSTFHTERIRYWAGRAEGEGSPDKDSFQIIPREQIMFSPLSFAFGGIMALVIATAWLMIERIL